MLLTVRPAKNQESAFAWPIYNRYIGENIFGLSGSKLDKSDWLLQEETKFKDYWSAADAYIIEVDGSPVGWISTSKANNTLTIQNVFVDDGWQDKGIGEKLFSEMIPTWKAERRVVEVPILITGTLSEEIQRGLERLGFEESGSDGLVRMMRVNFS
ncbi:GNAT family N-acetyltransferase [Mesorhizobium sp. M0815]|uniref:GNAT family N-acetyltransferase n=1 Tax=Mesorhizobium sp. M0815 TaxID=2957005 RepID=UPI003338AE38